MIVADRVALLAYFNARSFPDLERSFRAGGRRQAICIDVDPAGREVLIATQPMMDDEVITVLAFPFHVSDFLGSIERDRILSEAKGKQ